MNPRRLCGEAIRNRFPRSAASALLPLWLLVLPAVPMAASAATYYVSPSGSDSNSGASSAPFLTIQKAANLVKAGDTVIVRQGAYAGFVLSWDTPTAGTAAARITFQADPTAPAGSVVINNHNSKSYCGIDLEPGSAYITIDGFVVDGSGGIANYPNRGSGIKASGDYDIVRNCIVKNIDYGFGIFTGDTAGVIIQNNEVYNISWGSAANSNYGHGMYVSGNCTGTQVRGNRIHDNLYIGIHVNGDIGSSGAPGLVQGVVIENNLVYNNGQNALNCDGIQSSTIRNNLFYGYQTYGVCLYQIDAGGPCKNNLFANNTFVATRSGSAAALRIKDGATGNQVLNNILLAGDNNTYRISSDSLTGLVSDYNVVSSNFQSEDTGSAQSLASWRTSTGQDTHSFTATAASLFVNPAGSDYHLSSASPAIDKGKALSQVTTDLEGNPRPQGAGQDIGCYEYAGAVVPPSVTIASVAVNPTSVQGGTGSTGTVTLSAAAPSGGSVVSLSSSASSAASVPASVSVAAGQTSAPFAITTYAVSANTSATITGTLNGASKSATLTVTAAPASAALSSLSISPTSLTGGSSATGTVSLTTGAPSGGAVVSLSSNNAAVTVPASVTLPAGASTATFSVSTSAVAANTTVIVTATYQGVSKTATVTLTPAATNPTTQTLAVTADAYVWSGSQANTNEGTRSRLIVKKDADSSSSNYGRCTYLKFDLTSVKSVPTSATLTMTIASDTDPGTETINVYSVSTTSWTETGITWNNAPGLNRTNFSSTGTLLTGKNVNLTPGVVSFDVTAFVKANIGKVVTLQVLCPTKQNLYGSFLSRENSSGGPALKLSF